MKTKPQQKIAVIIGAGPAGLTAAYELLCHSDIKPIIIEREKYCGGLSATLNYKGNGIDIGGHRFYSKSAWVMNWWQQFLPMDLQGNEQKNKQSNKKHSPKLLVRNRLSRILFKGELFDYPLSLTWQTLQKFPLQFLFSMAFSYIWIKCFPIAKERNLEDFYINRFGKKLYQTFFKNYTEKIWGVPCSDISPEWGPQRVKGLSIFKAIKHAIKQTVQPSKKSDNKDIDQHDIETSLIERFLYPEKGPGQLWQEVASKITALGGEIYYEHTLCKIDFNGGNVCSITAKNSLNQENYKQGCDYLLSSMPIKNLVSALNTNVPEKVHSIAKGLCYRDYIIVGLLLNKPLNSNSSFKLAQMQDNWLYIQEPEVQLGRVQIFNNWSPALVKNDQQLWVGLEYFCQQNDEFWCKSDEQIYQFASQELAQINLAPRESIVGHKVFRIEKAYPAYFGSYSNFATVKQYIDDIENLFLIGRNGMHRYNNQDHSMLAAKAAVDCIVTGSIDKSTLWQVNSESDYIEK